MNNLGDEVHVDAGALAGVIPRPGTIVPVSRGSWGFDVAITRLVDGGYRGRIVDLWGDPCE